MHPFKTIPSLPTALIANLETLGYQTMTEIQAETIPIALSGKDLIAQAKTGSGKTAAFGIPLILKIDTAIKDPQALIMTPTRELADQVSKELRRLSRYRENIKIATLTGGVPMRGQISSLQKGAHIVVGTPGRLQDHLSRDTLPLYDIKTLVLDEADRMLDMGFYEEISKIVSNLPRQRQSLLFSATFPDKITQLSKHILNHPERITIASAHMTEVIEQIAYEVTPASKPEALLQILRAEKPESALLFCNRKTETEVVAEALHTQGFASDLLHGDLDQRGRDEALLMFANGTTRVLVATDVASRGLDIPQIALVINYDLPHDPEIYTHRIGRTGRAGATGKAITLVTPAEAAKQAEIAPQAQQQTLAALKPDKGFIMESQQVTLCIDGGKKAKLRAGDILGTLCKEIGLSPDQIGKITIQERQSYVAVARAAAEQAYRGLQKGRIKKRKFRVWWL